LNKGDLYIFLTGAFLLVGNIRQGMSQQDSLWHGEVGVSFSTQSDLRPGNKFALNNYSFKANDNKTTLVASLIQLKQKDTEGLRYDLSYYNTRKEGYSLIKISHSTSSWFARWTGEAKYWHNLSKPLALGIGVRHVSYKDTKVNMVSADLTYYLKNWMFNYAYTTQIKGNAFQILKIRKYGKRATNYLEISGGNSAQIAKGLDWQIGQVHSKFVQLGIQQSVSDNLKIRCTAYYNQFTSTVEQRSFVDYQFSISRNF